MAGSAPTNSAAVDFEKQQAAEAAAKEAKRQADLQQGISAINAIYDPQPVMGTKTSPYDWSTFKPGSGIVPSPGSIGGYAQAQPTGVPVGYTAVQIPGTPGGATLARGPAGQTASAAQLDPGRYNPTAAAGGSDTGYAVGGAGRGALPTATATSGGGAAGGTTWGLQDASGKIYRQGDPLNATSQYNTGQTTGGFGDPYYKAYNQKILDYYNPDEQRQYDEARRNLQYSLARAGTLQSSTAADKQGELAYQDAINKAQIVSSANDQTGQLRDTIQANKQSLINQLYTTEDPTLTANLAQSSANASQLKNPTLTPMAGLFNAGLSTVGSGLSALTSPYSTVPPGYGAGAATSPTPAPASASSGKTYS